MATPKEKQNLKSDKRDKIEVEEDVIATLAAGAVQRVPGVYKMHGSVVGDLIGLLGKEAPSKGVHVRFEESGKVSIDVHLEVEYKSSIPQIASQVQQEVRKFVESTASVEVEKVRVFVEDVRPAE
ncbi:hypothetical protein HKBW3S44_00533 [Candidatus Hakubella thermalkaliphila]|uniref:Asp23/Gls24 family envelope stress response protein n=1 Tax=Candidatus Hakubella thermalkaliphila TaxID=2754717 RepID=A0A6V8NU66_9ACTN|nr:Asp23/Gls24 family envelope stress response protein [Candidatus Hakubella thermalkaliphila]GFP22970.1 hypothetical protein HKBW3S09_00437 [Candidatus Hakubella thermalkaliphila]GFP29354.1 hypothetical protein HKBW3S34_00274 [Candidatus Hakubella thermalkaliphila]GFP36852.1 hypothetical protein HKBW3S44_00533 [Candidatus Hakubella thermalkaliphila]GFP40527.1 hypothetical protein HKBW3S47_02224 [Candidatus Hakubella thermalkaliphila]